MSNLEIEIKFNECCELKANITKYLTCREQLDSLYQEKTKDMEIRNKCKCDELWEKSVIFSWIKKDVLRFSGIHVALELSDRKFHMKMS